MAGYYVSVLDGKRKGLLLGPYDTHQEALDNVKRGISLAVAADTRAVFYAFGTVKITAETLPKAVFNT